MAEVAVRRYSELGSQRNVSCLKLALFKPRGRRNKSWESMISDGRNTEETEEQEQEQTEKRTIGWAYASLIRLGKILALRLREPYGSL